MQYNIILSEQTNEAYCMYNSGWEATSHKQKLWDEVCDHRWKMTNSDTLLYEFLGLEEAP